jgi:hypothetical protein
MKVAAMASSGNTSASTSAGSSSAISSAASGGGCDPEACSFDPTCFINGACGICQGNNCVCVPIEQCFFDGGLPDGF